MRKQLFILGIGLLCSINFLSAQITFQKTFGGTSLDWGYSIRQTTDAGYIITGYTFSFGAGSYDVYLTKTDVNGDLLWTKTFGGAGVDFGNSVQQTTDGGYIIAGHTYSFGANDAEIYLIKTDANGDSLWTKTFGGAIDDLGNSVQQTTDGGYIIAGLTNSFGAGGWDVYLLKTDANGVILWTKTFGGTGGDFGNSVEQTTDGGYIISGETNSFGAGIEDIYVIKTDANGDTLWTKTYGGGSADGEKSIQQTTDGGFIICGYTAFSASDVDVYLIKTDVNGDTLWTKTFRGTGPDYGWFVQQTTDGGYAVAGLTQSFGAGNYDCYLIKTDSDGDTLWTRTFGGTSEDYGYCVQQTTDGGYIISGFYGTNTDAYLIKTDSLGNSGCNGGSAPFTITNSATQVTNPPTIVTSPVTIESSSATMVSSGGIAATLCTTVGIKNENVLDNTLVISPNPSAGDFMISFERTIIKGNVEILNIVGVPVNIGIAENIFNESKVEIKLKNISDGIYFVKVFDGEKYYGRKIIIERN